MKVEVYKKYISLCTIHRIVHTPWQCLYGRLAPNWPSVNRPTRGWVNFLCEGLGSKGMFTLGRSLFLSNRNLGWTCIDVCRDGRHHGNIFMTGLLLIGLWSSGRWREGCIVCAKDFVSKDTFALGRSCFLSNRNLGDTCIDVCGDVGRGREREREMLPPPQFNNWRLWGGGGGGDPLLLLFSLPACLFFQHDT